MVIEYLKYSISSSTPHVVPASSDENHDTAALNSQPVFIPLNQLFEAILDLGA